MVFVWYKDGGITGKAKQQGAGKGLSKKHFFIIKLECFSKFYLAGNFLSVPFQLNIVLGILGTKSREVEPLQ